MIDRTRSAAAPERLWAGRPALIVAIVLAASSLQVALAPATGAGASGPDGPRRAGIAASGTAAGADANLRPGGLDETIAADALDPWGLLDRTPAGSTAGPAIVEPPAQPAIVRFRPRHGWTDVDRHAELSVRFATAMDHATTEAAFHASIGTTELTGTLRWAEGDTVLVLRPATALPYGARVQLLVDTGAVSAAGMAIAGASSITFTVEDRPVAAPPGIDVASGGWTWPLEGPITQAFGQSLTRYGVHQGIDIDGDTGDPVKAAAAGVVVVAGHADECGGLQVRIDHGGGLLTWYRHLSAIETVVGARVAVGTVVGRVGATGCALGSHLHFGVSLAGQFVDPLRYLPRR